MNERYHGGAVPPAAGMGSFSDHYAEGYNQQMKAMDAHVRHQRFKHITLGAARWVGLTFWALCLIGALIGGLKQVADEGITVRFITPGQHLPGLPPVPEHSALEGRGKI